MFILGTNLRMVRAKMSYRTRDGDGLNVEGDEEDEGDEARGAEIPCIENFEAK